MIPTSTPKGDKLYVFWLSCALFEVNACGKPFNHRSPQIPSWDRPAEPGRPDPLQIIVSLQTTTFSLGNAKV